jgi:membrane protein DedA with SNARE-associated domain
VSSDLAMAAAAYLFLTVVVLCRAGATYALGRWARRAGDGSRVAALFERPAFRRSEELVGRFGAPAVAASFLTVGFQSAMNLSAGFLRMPLRHYLPALGVGALIWAGIYLSVGVAVLAAWSSSGRAVPVTAAIVLAVALAGLAVLVHRRLVLAASH